METNELKPCKCGCEAELISSQAFAWCNIYWYVRCTNEDCEERTLKYDTKRDAIAAWNRREENGLDAEQIIYCIAQDIEFGCGMYREVDVTHLKQALALIKELTEEIQKWQEAYDYADAACRELNSKCDELTEENESLVHEVIVKRKWLDLAEGCINRVKADTVREMWDRLKTLFPCDKHFTTISRATIYQIAQEMLEGK